MDNILEILIPLAIAAVYFFGNMFSGKSEDDESSPSPLSRTRETGEKDPDTVEQQRRVQEEIRRKIMERRRASEGKPTTAAPPGQALRERREGIEAQREARREREVYHDVQGPTSPDTESSYELDPESEPRAFSWDLPDNAYENSMQAKLRRIEETRKKAEKLKKQAAERGDASKSNEKQRKQRNEGYFTGSVRESLQDPQAARVAFIYGEVMGQPISLRKDSSSVPGLNRS